MFLPPATPRKQILKYVRAFDMTRSREHARRSSGRLRGHVSFSLAPSRSTFHSYEKILRSGFSRNPDRSGARSTPRVGATTEKREREREKRKRKKRNRTAERNELLDSAACYSRSHFLHSASTGDASYARECRRVQIGTNGRTSEHPRRRWRLPRIRVIISVS